MLNLEGVDHERDSVVQPCEHDELDELLGRKGRGQFAPQLVADTAGGVQLIRQADDGVLFHRPAAVQRTTMRGGLDLLRRPRCLGSERGDMDAPLLLRPAPSARPQDHEFAKAQGYAASIEQAARKEALKHARIASHRAEQQERRSSAHDLVELRLYFSRERRIDRSDSWVRHQWSRSSRSAKAS